MKKIIGLLIFSLVGFCLFAGCVSQVPEAIDHEVAKNIAKVDSFPAIPAQYSYYDYQAAALALDAVVFSFASDPEAVAPSYMDSDADTWNPIGFWIDQPRQPDVYDPLITGYLKRSFGLPTYVGDSRVISSGSEAITTISMVLGSSFAGLDKSSQAYADILYDFVEMTLASYDTGSELVHNVGAQGQSFWYDIFPQIMFARLYALYQDTPYMREMVLNGADQWLEAIPHFVDLEGNVSYDFVGYNVVLEAPTLVGDHIEPPNGGLSFLFYAAYEMTRETKYLDGCKAVLDYLQDLPYNPNYEAMTDYAPFVAAALNARYGTAYDVGKFLDFVFENDSVYRSGWSVQSGNFGNYAVDGLVGQTGDYAFSMNSFHLASVLAPMVKYDARYASAIGRYLLNLVGNAQVFFTQNLPLSNQTMTQYLSYDHEGALCYEGFRNDFNGRQSIAMGDATAMFGQPSDLSVYSSAFIGALGGLVEETNVEGILKIDLNATDSFGQNAYPNYLFYNPFESDRTIDFAGSDAGYDLYDAVSKRIVAYGVRGTSHVLIPANASVLLVVLPEYSVVTRQGNDVMVDGQIIARYMVAVNLIGLASRAELTAQSVIRIGTQTPLADEVVSMTISFDDIIVYNGTPITAFSYEKAMLPDTDYTLKVEIITTGGLTDYVTRRVICR